MSRATRAAGAAPAPPAVLAVLEVLSVLSLDAEMTSGDAGSPRGDGERRPPAL
ncbi:hypothetical protein NicSoilB4_13630 [Arthrobacter sp. NicSoilB4]|nr:hypothetical protein NicSoilB4_13630 [Arthrobacter sp. NicSoilB4]